MGLDAITGERPAFINVTRHLLTTDFATVMPPGMVVLELLEDIVVDQEVVDICRDLHKRGYLLALDDFIPDTASELLFPFVRFVKVDVLSIDPGIRAAMKTRVPRGVRLLAEKVEDEGMHQSTLGEGYELFQGYYFCKPTTLEAEAVPFQKLSYLRLLAALSRPDLSVQELEDLVKRDASLVHRVLRCVNSASFAFRTEIRSINQALVMLGFDQIRKWTAVWSLAGLSSGGSPEIVNMAIIRGRCCESLGAELSGRDTGAEYFLMGLCSLLDVMLSRPMEIAIAELSLAENARTALLGGQNTARTVLDAVIAYERGEWAAATAAVTGVGLSDTTLAEAYGDALKWARELNRQGAGTGS
ncbi:MAG: EAL and HDOD domain-containing protein [Vicinamibacterales bacterium]